MSWSIRLRRTGIACAVAVLVLVPALLRAVDSGTGGVGAPATTAPATKPVRTVGEEGGVENYGGLRKKRMSEQELGRLRMLEIESGAFRDAHAGAQSTQLVGPPLSDREKVMHALSRLAFGPKPGEVERILQEGGDTDQWKTWAKKQLQPDTIDDKAADAALAKQFAWYGKSMTELRQEYAARGGGGDAKSVRTLTKELPESIIVRAASSNRQFKEVMCDFWRNHFCIDNSPNDPKVRSFAAIDYEEKVIRANVFGKFKMMLFASARHPAMLEYLDNELSRANAWNENYAREVMELHTLGADRGYNDADVIQLSQILTGWRYNRNSYEFGFEANLHQPGTKTLMGIRFPAGYEGGEQALYMLATHRNTADFIARKLCKYLVNDAPPEALVKKVAGVFQQTEGDLPKVYEAILFSPEFMDRGNYHAKFRRPFEFVVAALRATDATVNDATASAVDLRKMGEEVYNCPDPTGYYDRAEAWLDSGVLTSRWDYAWALVRGQVRGARINPSVLANYREMKSDDAYRAMVRDLIADDIGDKTRTAMKEAADAGDTARMLGVLLGSPSFQQQ